jgi:NitT/TauT family transport system ATP-binding protein
VTALSEAPTRRLAQAASASIEVRGLSRTFADGTNAIASLDLHIPAGQFVSVVGPSGCGKSTLLRIIAGLDHPTSGSLDLRCAGHAPRLAYVFQDAHLLPWRRVIDNVTLPLEFDGSPRDHALAVARSALESVGLTDFALRYPAQLSGGMRMRVSLARAMASDPDVLLLDEPFAALDEITRQSLDEMLRNLWRRRGMTVVFVTHSINEAAYLSQRVVVLTRRPARIVTDRVIDLPDERPAELRVEARFASQARDLIQALSEGQSR